MTDGNWVVPTCVGLMHKLMLNIGSPFTNMMAPSNSFLAEVSGARTPAPAAAAPAQLPPVGLLDLMEVTGADAMDVVSLTPTLDAGHLVAVLAPRPPSAMPASDSTDPARCTTHFIRPFRPVKVHA